MYEALEYEFAEFKKDFDKGTLVFGKYFEEDEYEDEYSHNQIDEYKCKFVEKVKEYLHENAPNQYAITDGWAVLVMTIEEARKRGFTRVEEFTIK